MREPDLDTVNRTLSVTVQKLQADLAAADRLNRELRALVLALLESDPNALAADGGVTVLDVWRAKARAAIGGDNG
jgi:hypothetical protein